jgi:hypothetical protein
MAEQQTPVLTRRPKTSLKIEPRAPHSSRMKPKTLILLLVAGCSGVVGSYLTSLVTAQLAVQTEAEKVSVLVARQNIATGTLFRDPDQFFEEKPFIKGEDPTGAIRSSNELKDRRLNKPLRAEQFVTAGDLSEPEKKEPAREQEPGTRKEIANSDQATLAAHGQRTLDQVEQERKQKIFDDNLVKSLDRVVSDAKRSTRNRKERAEQHRSMLGRYERAEQTLTEYGALLQGQREQEQMDDLVRRMEARDKRLEKLTEQLRQAVSVRDWERAAKVHSRILKECAEARR